MATWRPCCGVVRPGPAGSKSAGSEPAIPVMVKRLPQSREPMTDVHRFWEQTGNFYARGMGNDTITDPFIGPGVMPAGPPSYRTRPASTL